MIKFSKKKTVLDEVGVIEMHGVGSIANAIRRILLDELETVRFDVSNANFTTNDPFITLQMLIQLSLIYLYEEGEFYLDITNNTSMPINVYSNNIKNVKNHAEARVEPGVFICELSPKCKIKITNITSHRGTGRKHAKFTRVYGQVKYTPTDVHHVYFLNDRGFVENNRRCIKRTKDIDINKKYIIWNKTGEKNISEQDLKIFKDFIKIPAGDWEFRRAELHLSEDFIIEFMADNVEEAFKQAIETLLRDLDNKEMTLTVGDLVRTFVLREKECPIFGDWEMQNNNSYKLTIEDPNEEKLVQNAVANIKKILKNVTYN
jgi:hypothetical protein